MIPFLYLWQPLREKYIKELTTIEELFFEKINPVFADAEREAEDFQNKAWNEFMEQPCPSDEYYIDPADFVDTCVEIGVERYEILSLMRYRTLAMWIACLCQVWEQQLIKFIIDEGQKCGLKYNANYIKKGFAFAKDAFLNHGIDFEKMASWPKINELRKLVNTLKHADGDAANALRKMRPDYFHWENSSFYGRDTLQVYGSTLLDETLKISTDDFVEYRKALLAFWNELPENMTWCGGELSYE